VDMFCELANGTVDGAVVRGRIWSGYIVKTSEIPTFFESFLS